MAEHYVFATEAEAVAAAQYVSNAGGCPRTPKRRGKPNQNGPKTTRWAIPRQRATDGKWHFERVPQEFLATADQGAVAYFRQNFTYTLETPEPSWYGGGENP